MPLMLKGVACDMVSACQANLNVLKERVLHAITLRLWLPSGAKATWIVSLANLTSSTGAVQHESAHGIP